MQADARQFPAKFETLAAQGVDAATVAATALADWRKVEAQLSPIIGKVGMSALFKRSIHLSSGSFPWLSAAFDNGGPDAAAFTALHDLLLKQTVADAAAANALVLQTFSDLLYSLIGGALTARIMEPADRARPGGPPLQDPLP